MQTIIHDTTIVTADEQCTVHYDAAIVIDRIAALGPKAELLVRYPAAERIDGRGKAVMPGFANVHTHFGSPSPVASMKIYRPRTPHRLRVVWHLYRYLP